MGKGTFSKAELQGFHGATTPDLLPQHHPLRLLFVGINPSLWTAAAGAHFARPGNRFWPALHAAGILPEIVDASAGMPADAEAAMDAQGIGITNLVAVATARADELTSEQLAVGGERLRTLVRERRPVVVAILGLTAYRQAFGKQARHAVPGRQPDDFEGAELWVLANPSGLNAHETVASLASAYQEAAVAAGIEIGGSGNRPAG